MADEYEGWSNRETWLVNLWLNNDESNYRTALAICVEGPSRRAGDLLKEMVERMTQDQGPPSLRRDLLMTALDRVDWREIAQSIASP